MAVITWYNLPNIVKKLQESTLNPSEPVVVLAASTNLPATPASFADLSAARTSVEALRAAAETRLDNIEAKLNELITGLTTEGIIQTA